MKETLEKLWRDYLADECAAIDTKEERELSKKAIVLQEKANALMSEEGKDTLQSYVDALCDINAIFAEKAFFKGCEFALSFLLEARGESK